MSSSILTYLVDAAIDDATKEAVGEVHTRPALVKTDGLVLTYACDVVIKGYDLPLRNVPIAAGVRELVYASIGSAVKLSRTSQGRFEITGFAKTKPGTRRRVPVNLETMIEGDAVRTGRWSRVLTFEELMTLGNGFGRTPLGVYGIWDGDTFVGVGV